MMLHRWFRRLRFRCLRCHHRHMQPVPKPERRAVSQPVSHPHLPRRSTSQLDCHPSQPTRGSNQSSTAPHGNGGRTSRAATTAAAPTSSHRPENLSPRCPLSPKSCPMRSESAGAGCLANRHDWVSDQDLGLSTKAPQMIIRKSAATAPAATTTTMNDVLRHKSTAATANAGTRASSTNWCSDPRV